MNIYPHIKIVFISLFFSIICSYIIDFFLVFSLFIMKYKMDNILYYLDDFFLVFLVFTILLLRASMKIVFIQIFIYLYLINYLKINKYILIHGIILVMFVSLFFIYMPDIFYFRYLYE